MKKCSNCKKAAPLFADRGKRVCQPCLFAALNQHAADMIRDAATGLQKVTVGSSWSR